MFCRHELYPRQSVTSLPALQEGIEVVLTQCKCRCHLISGQVSSWMGCEFGCCLKSPLLVLGAFSIILHIHAASYRGACSFSGSSWTRCYFLALTHGSVSFTHLVWSSCFMQSKAVLSPACQWQCYQPLWSSSAGINLAPTRLVTPYVCMDWESVQVGMGYVREPINHVYALLKCLIHRDNELTEK